MCLGGGEESPLFPVATAWQLVGCEGLALPQRTANKLLLDGVNLTPLECSCNDSNTIAVYQFRLSSSSNHGCGIRFCKRISLSTNPLDIGNGQLKVPGWGFDITLHVLRIFIRSTGAELSHLQGF